MSRNEVNSTVLILAVIAGSAAFLLTNSGQEWLCGAAGLTILIALFAFDVEGARSVGQSLAFAAVCGFALAIAIVPVEPILFAVSGPPKPNGGDMWLAIVWLGSTILFLIIDRARMSGRVIEPSARPSLRMTPASAPPPVPVEIRPQPVVVPPPPPPPPTPEPVLVREEAPPPPPPAPAAPQPAPVPIPAGKLTNIYVNLTGEGLNLLRSVQAEHLGRDYYRIVETTPPDETWEYPTGAVVRAKKKNLSSGKALVAYEEAPRAQ